MSNPTSRPNFIDLRTSSSSAVMARPPRSPLLHVAGDIPPDLSPLDAFAMQSRLLARQLEEAKTKDGNRVSRLPPLTTLSPLIVKSRSDYFRFISQETSPELELQSIPLNPLSAGAGMRTAELTDAFDDIERPLSMHPRMSRIPPTPNDHSSMPAPSPSSIPASLSSAPSPAPLRSASPRGRGHDRDESKEGYFGARRELSPGQLDPDELVPSASRESSLALPAWSASRRRQTSPDNLRRPSNPDAAVLLPPPHLPRSTPQSRRPSAQSLAPGSESDAVDELTAMSSSVHSLPVRESLRASDMLPSLQAMKRSPSVTSESSAVLPRPSFNFSRPLSRSGTPSSAMEPNFPMRQASSDSQPSIIADGVATPISVYSDAFEGADDHAVAAQSYIYSKFALPRGKSVQRNVPLDRSLTSDAVFPTAVAAGGASLNEAATRPSSPTRPATSSGRLEEEPDLSKTSQDGSSEEERPRGRAPAASSTMPDPPRLLTAQSTTTVTSARTAKTARSHGLVAAEMSAEEHLAKGIDCHEKGSVNESTYHLRHAAKMNNPTAMLLYALACRHGWGMRPNPSEGVEWLKKAANFASVEIADDEGLVKEGKHVDMLDSRTHKAQFALSIYELGISHMNGWGTEQDKALALRCFEIAGSWGDVDALAEAGFCYAKGVGCKKDLKKSAKFYRIAESKGMSMVGNSWIHKSKYNDEGDAKKKRPRSKSRTRTMFGLK